MFLPKEKLEHISSITHEGKVIVFCSDAEGKIYYTIKQDGFEDSYGNTEVLGWENWQFLEFPNEVDDLSVIEKEKEELTYSENGNTSYLLKSLYRSQNQTAIAPVQLISGLGHLYVFRQSKSNTLLVDRFVLDGLTNTLVRALDVRFKRSRQKYQPLKNTNNNAANSQLLVDSLDYRDGNNNLFFEPTIEISLVNYLENGLFSVVLLPTNEQDKYRWQIFAFNNTTQQVELTSIRTAENGLFDVKDETILEAKPGEPETFIPRIIPGIIKRTLILEEVKIANGLTATKYDTQVEREIQTGKQLLRESTKVMLVVGTEQGNAAAISFAVAEDGTLAQIDQSPQFTTLRSSSRDILLPLNTLDEIKAIGKSEPLPQGTITGMARAEGDRISITSAQAQQLNYGDIVKVAGTNHYNGYYITQKIDENTFEIQANWVASEVGSWEILPEEETGLVFDGIITAYEKTADGKLRITSPNHGLEEGDEVQIIETQAYNGTYPVTQIESDRFTIGINWQAGEAVNLQLQSRKRRGISFDGQKDYLEIPALPLKTPSPDYSFGETYSAWVYLPEYKSQQQLIIAQKAQLMQLGIQEGKVVLQVLLTSNLQQIEAANTIPEKQWVHYAGVFDYDKNTQKTTLILTQNGQEIAKQTFDGVPKYEGKWQPEFLIGKGFSGKIADVQIWDKVRTPQEIKDSMYLQLTGREVSLAGYWRMGAIMTGKERHVVDFSVHGKDGIVYGEAFVSAVTLDRTLRDGKTKVVKYANDELFAVTQRATYEESFEFKLDTDINPNQVDSKENKVFTLSYWGKANRSSEERIEFAGEIADFASLEDGWYKATAHFTVPDDITLVRSLELTNVTGNWKSLEIRKHRMQLVSDSITAAHYHDEIPLVTLDDKQVALEKSLKQLEPLERRESLLFKEKRELEAQLALLNDPTLTTRLQQTEQSVNSFKAKVIMLAGEVTSLQQQYTLEVNNPFNYWHRLTVRSREGNDEAARIYTDSKSFIQGLKWGNYGNQRFKFEQVDGDYYTIICQYENRILDLPTGGSYDIYGNTDHHRRANQQWRLERRSDGYYTIRCRWESRVMDLRDNSHSIIGYHTHHGQANQQWKLIKLADAANQKIANAYNALTAKQQEHKQAQERLQTLETELSQLRAITANKTAQKTALESRLKVVEEQLKAIQSELNRLNNEFINGVIATQQTPQTMPVINTDARELITQAALLGFVRPISRLSAMESSEGNVQLSYFDNNGRMRQTNFDAASDSLNATFEQWIPDSLRVCLFCDQSNSVVLLNNPLSINGDWTIEAWFVYPLPQMSQWNTLTRAKDVGDHQIIVRNGNQLGTYVNDRFYESGYSLDQLSSGWHHLTAVGKGTGTEATTTFYLDGKKVATASAKSISDIYAIANSSGGTQPFGKVAEVRIWQVALNEEEIEINSKTILSSNEPGLIAYYPLNEAKGTEIRDYSVYSRHAQMQSGIWFGCTAPIGNPGHPVIQFDGVNDYIEIASHSRLNLTNNFTLEAWVKTKKLNGIQRIFSKAGAYGFGLIGEQIRFTTYGRQDYDTNKAKLAVDTWYHLAVVLDRNNTAHFYVDGELIQSINGTQSALVSSNACEIGRYNSELWQGNLSEIRLWNTTRSPSEIQSTLHKRLSGGENNLVGYWALNQIDMTRSPQTVADLTGNHPGIVREALIVSDNALPIANKALISSEYSTIGIDPDTYRKSAMMRRFLATPCLDGVTLLPDKRIEILELKWIGNTQFAPTLLGYIEGAPPLPSENLTLEDDYNGATAVELVQSQDVEYSWNRAQDAGLGASGSTFIGVDSQTFAGIGVATSIESTHQGFVGNLDLNYNFQNESSITASSGLSLSDRLELRGTQEQTAKFPHLGKRFVPKNIGYALVVSALADVFITRLKRSQRMVGYQVSPVDGIPPDVNTITFLINPAYTMNGSLDGLTGTSATSDRFFPHVPEMRANYGSLYPASYYRLQEAYDLKQQVDQEDARRQAYFAHFNARLLDEASLDREIDKGEAPQAISVNRAEDQPNPSSSETQQEEDRIRQDADARVNRQSQAVERKQAEIAAKIQDQERRTQATESFALWQKKMENIQIRAGKRNIVNNYVWDADGGLRVEEQSFASTVEHSIGGSFSLNAGLGFEGEFGAKVTVGLSALATVNLTQTLSKTETRSQGFALNIDLSGVESRGITNHDDYPILPGEKVDRYRFMSFYLEGSTHHFYDFFNYVVDPQWLRSNDEEARALRQTMGGRANKTWRVLHRVTYIERPALMGFSRDIRSLAMTEAMPDNAQLLAKIERLEQENQSLAEKLDKIVFLLQSKQG